jgi:hypothetical protein
VCTGHPSTNILPLNRPSHSSSIFTGYMQQLPSPPIIPISPLITSSSPHTSRAPRKLQPCSSKLWATDCNQCVAWQLHFNHDDHKDLDDDHTAPSSVCRPTTTTTMPTTMRVSTTPSTNILPLNGPSNSSIFTGYVQQLPSPPITPCYLLITGSSPYASTAPRKLQPHC